MKYISLVLAVASFLLTVSTFVEEERFDLENENAMDFTPEAQNDLITELPGLRNPGKRRMFSGYIPVEGEGRGKFLTLIAIQ